MLFVLCIYGLALTATYAGNYAQIPSLCLIAINQVIDINPELEVILLRLFLRVS
jgi:hypothetical protein